LQIRPEPTQVNHLSDTLLIGQAPGLTHKH
jgi:hypothetical protein